MNKQQPTIYTFDASVSVEAKSKEEAAELIIFHCIGRPADIAIALHEEGTLNHAKLEAAEATIKAVGELKGRTFKSLNACPVGLPEGEYWVRRDDLQQLLKKHHET